MMNTYYVYEHRKADTGEVFYIGKGKKYRAYEKGAKRNPYWNNIVNKHGRTVNFIAEGIDEELALLIEVEAIDTAKKRGVVLCNITDGGEGSWGFKHTEAHKQHMSDIQKGKQKTEEHKQNMRKPKSEQGRQAIAEAQKKLRAGGFKPSEEAKRKTSEALKGRLITAEHATKIGDALRGRCTEKVECPHCGKIGGVSLMRRWHFGNCKVLEEVA